MHTVHQCIEILTYQLIMSVVADVNISCALMYCCVSQILTYQLNTDVVIDMRHISCASAYHCLTQRLMYQLIMNEVTGADISCALMYCCVS